MTNISAMLRGREGNLSGTGRFTRAQRAHVTAFRSTPMEAVQQVDRKRSRVYNGRFSRSGALFVGALRAACCDTELDATTFILLASFHDFCAGKACLCRMSTNSPYVCCPRAAGFQQDHIIRVYESSNGYAVRKNVHARNLRWTITDCDVSPSEAFMVYCSITPTVHMVRMMTTR